jgi:hypothetical protein
MHVVRETPNELVIKDSSLWLAAVFVIAGVAVAFFGIARSYPLSLLVSLVLLLFAAPFARTVKFTFSSTERVARWRGRKLFKVESGSVAFDEITGVGTETTASSKGGLSFRLTLLTAQSSIPMAYTLQSGEQHYARLRQKILGFIHPGAPVPADLTGAGGMASEASIRALLHLGRKIDAIELLRTSANIGLTEATERVNAIDAKRKAGG